MCWPDLTIFPQNCFSFCSVMWGLVNTVTIFCLLQCIFTCFSTFSHTYFHRLFRSLFSLLNYGGAISHTRAQKVKIVRANVVNVVTVLKKDGGNVKYVYLCDEKTKWNTKKFWKGCFAFLSPHTSERMELIPQIPASDLRHGCLSSYM